MGEGRSFFSGVSKSAALVLCIPLVIVMQVLGSGAVALFIVSGLGILGTVAFIGKATEDIACYSGPVWGGFLNATFGNVTELIIGLFALNKGLTEIVRYSITGSILGNLLLVLGGAMFYGGTKFQTQKFSRVGAQVNMGMLWVALIIMLIPSLVHHTIPSGSSYGAHFESDFIARVSIFGAVVLLLVYLMNLVFSLKTHRFVIMPEHSGWGKAGWSKGVACAMLFLSTITVAYLSHVFVDAIEHVSSGVLSHSFIGVIIVAIVGNAAEGMVAVWVARDKDDISLSYQIAMGSCLQVALAVAPILVLASAFMGNFMSLAFQPMELMVLASAILISSASLNDGESNWLEGGMFLLMYLFIAVVFWFYP